MNSSPKNASQSASPADDAVRRLEADLDDCALETTACGLPQFYCAEGYDPGQSTGYLMRQIMASVSHQVSRELEPSGLTNAQWVPMFKLYLGHASTVAELARGCQLDAGSMTRLLDRLEAKGLCNRVRSSEDRRVVNIELTPDGREAASKITEVLSRVQNAHLAGFSHDEWQTLKGFLRRMHENAQAMPGAQPSHGAQAAPPSMNPPIPSEKNDQ
ncbi:MAG: MarR family transcriptional regulator [Comamonadaceae bacterium]|nr:MAG: MarR family transcriptional regulator [Comamonadaceae bacterium]